MKKVLIIDYGAGNLKSISKALEVLGLEVKISNRVDKLNTTELIVLPGVGEFSSVMKFIKKTSLDELLNLHIKLSKPLLGICLGMQLLFNRSEEVEGGVKKGSEKVKGTVGLKFLPGEIVRFKTSGNQSGLYSSLPIPHMCWNKVKFVNISHKKKILVNGLKQEEYFYFVHSYYPVCNEKEIVFGLTNYINEFTSMIVKNNIVATQFHLEKSGNTGLKLLKNIIEYFRKM